MLHGGEPRSAAGTRALPQPMIMLQILPHRRNRSSICSTSNIDQLTNRRVFDGTALPRYDRRASARIGRRAMPARELRQDRKVATVSGHRRVPRSPRSSSWSQIECPKAFSAPPKSQRPLSPAAGNPSDRRRVGKHPTVTLSRSNREAGALPRAFRRDARIDGQARLPQ
jgi:hypothetical protein